MQLAAGGQVGDPDRVRVGQAGQDLLDAGGPFGLARSLPVPGLRAQRLLDLGDLAAQALHRGHRGRVGRTLPQLLAELAQLGELVRHAGIGRRDHRLHPGGGRPAQLDRGQHPARLALLQRQPDVQLGQRPAVHRAGGLHVDAAEPRLVPGQFVQAGADFPACGSLISTGRVQPAPDQPGVQPGRDGVVGADHPAFGGHLGGLPDLAGPQQRLGGDQLRRTGLGLQQLGAELGGQPQRDRGQPRAGPAGRQVGMQQQQFRVPPPAIVATAAESAPGLARPAVARRRSARPAKHIRHEPARHRRRP